jgi:hypothetical protein
MAYMPMPLVLPEGHSLSEAVALSLMQQFSVMQQQLFNHTQNLLAVMAQSFSAAHAKQLDLIRDELLRVHEVNRELHDLNLKLTVARMSTPGPEGSALPETPSTSPAAVNETLPEQMMTPADPPATRAPRPAATRARPAAPRAPKSARHRGAAPQAPPADSPAGADMHAWLCGRINDLEHERTTRWQKILSILSPAGGPS